MDLRPEDVIAQASSSGLVLNSDGSVVSATGDFAGNQKAASQIYHIVLDAGGAFPAQGATLRKISISVGMAQYIIATSNSRIYAVKRT